MANEKIDNSSKIQSVASGLPVSGFDPTIVRMGDSGWFRSRDRTSSKKRCDVRQKFQGEAGKGFVELPFDVMKEFGKARPPGEATPAFPHLFDQRYLALMAWGFLVPFVWGFSAKWMGIFLGLKSLRANLLLGAVAVNLTGLVLTVVGLVSVGVWFFLSGTLLAIGALRMFEPAINEPKTRGVHASFPFFVRMAYAWLIVAASLSIVAVRWDHSGGIWGASRHALTVGFISVMILNVGQRILPAFVGMRQLWSTKLMFTGLGLLTLGCALRVSCEVLAYQGYAAWAWSVLPVSALVELSALTIYAINIFGTFLLEPRHLQKEPVMVGLPIKIS